jgi:hypothetical protein
MSTAFDLRRTQTFFWDLVTAPEGVRPGLEEMVRRGEAGAGDLEALIAGDDRLPAADRLDIYANMYFYRLLDCLKEDYPRLHEACGPGRFHNLVTDYLLRHPSEHPSLRHLGSRLPGFLEGHPLGRECPALVDLARLEWARADLFDAADAPALTRQDLARLGAEEAGNARFRLVPAFALLRLAHDAARLWTEMKERAAARAVAERLPDEGAGREIHSAAGMAAEACRLHQEETAVALPRPPRRGTTVRVWRRGFVVYHRSIDAEEADALDLLRDGEPLARIAQRLAAGRSAARATERFGRMLQGWIDDGLLAAGAGPG